MSAAFQGGLKRPGALFSLYLPSLRVLFEVRETPPPASLGPALTGYLLEALLPHPGPTPQLRF